MARTGPPDGHPRYGGRKKGSVNLKTKMLLDILQDEQFDPVSEALYIYEKALEEFEEDPGEFRFKYLEIAQKSVQDLMKYVYPQRKAIDHTSGGQPITFADLIKAASDLNEKK